MAEIAIAAVAAGAGIVQALSASDAVKQGLHSVKVSQSVANKVEDQLQKEVFEKWTESFETMKCTKVKSGNITKFLDHMEANYEGIDSDVRKKLDGIIFAEGHWEHRLVEWKFNAESTSNARYGMIAFGKSTDGQEIDCMYILYKMDFTLAPRETVTTKEHSLLFGLINWNTISKEIENSCLDFQMVKDLQNFFRLKALKGFYNEGLIDKINYDDDS